MSQPSCLLFLLFLRLDQMLSEKMQEASKLADEKALADHEDWRQKHELQSAKNEDLQKQLTQKTADIQRLRAENEAMQDKQRSLELTLENLQRDLLDLKLHAKKLTAENASLREVATLHSPCLLTLCVHCR